MCACDGGGIIAEWIMMLICRSLDDISVLVELTGSPVSGSSLTGSVCPSVRSSSGSQMNLRESADLRSQGLYFTLVSDTGLPYDTDACSNFSGGKSISHKKKRCFSHKNLEKYPHEGKTKCTL